MSAAQERPVRVRTENGITTLTLNQPERRNSLSMAMLEGLSSALEKIARDDSSRVVVLASAGHVFCAGHDLREMRDKFDSHEFQLALFQAVQQGDATDCEPAEAGDRPGSRCGNGCRVSAGGQL